MPEPFKNRFSPAVVARLGDLLRAQAADFDRDAFVQRGTRGLEALELKDRVRHISGALAAHLPGDFPRQARLLTNILSSHVNPRPDDGSIDVPDDAEDGVRGMPALVLSHYVGEHGLGHLELALDALAEITRRCSAEFEVRRFIAVDPPATWARIDDWSRAADVHLRRLASEGTRPYLPWATRLGSLIAEPDRNFVVLERLKDDPSSYVRRSVANHLNDLSRDHRDRVLEVATRWLAEREARRPLVKHALRTLSRRSDPGALALFGFDPEAPVTLSDFTVAGAVREGDKLPYRFRITHVGDRPAPILVEAVVYYVKSRGKRSPKVFQIARTELAPGRRVDFARAQDFRAVTTRKHYPGTHRIEIRVNGRVRAGGDFDLTVDGAP